MSYRRDKLMIGRGSYQESEVLRIVHPALIVLRPMQKLIEESATE